MDFALTREHNMCQRVARDFSERELAPVILLETKARDCRSYGIRFRAK